MVLLQLLVQAKQAIPFELHAMHVHHGLSAHADAWADFCTQQCALLAVPLKVVRVNANLATKTGTEAFARKLRYQALFSDQFNNDLLSQAEYIVTAHHQDDQAETLLLQLFRGAGAKGLASMAMMDESRRLLRPLLDVSRKQILDYAQANGVAWCEDESNLNTNFDRNYVRHEVLPILESRYPAAKSVLARTAAHLAETQALLDTFAALDAAPLLQDNSLCLQGLAQLDAGVDRLRAKQVLRWWFASHQLLMPNSEHLAEIMQQLFAAKSDANVSIELAGVITPRTLKRFQNRAYLVKTQTNSAFDMVWNGEPMLSLPNGGQLHFKQVIGAGLALKFGMTKLRITNRTGGERFKPNVLRPTRTLKHLLQEANIAPWQRDGLPLVYWQDTLAFVPYVGVAHDLAAAENESGLEIVWHSEALVI